MPSPTVERANVRKHYQKCLIFMTLKNPGQHRIWRDIGIEHFKRIKAGLSQKKTVRMWSLHMPVWKDDVHTCMNLDAQFCHLSMNKLGPPPHLTYYMQQSPSWEANRVSASQEIPRILRNPKVHYRTHNYPQPVPIPSQLNPIHTPTSHFLKTHLNIILPFTHGSPKWFSLRFPNKTLYTPLLSPYALHVPSISFFSILSPEQYWVRSMDH